MSFAKTRRLPELKQQSPRDGVVRLLLWYYSFLVRLFHPLLLARFDRRFQGTRCNSRGMVVDAEDPLRIKISVDPRNPKPVFSHGSGQALNLSEGRSW
jgi:hypothetical protein